MEATPFIAATRASVASLIGIAAQAWFQARSARIALLEKRLGVLNSVAGVLAISEDMHTSIYVHWDSVEQKKKTAVALEKEFHESLRSLGSQLPIAGFLFGLEVREPIKSLRGKGRLLHYAWKGCHFKDDECEPERVRERWVQVDELGKELDRLFDVYLGRDRLIGLPFLERGRRTMDSLQRMRQRVPLLRGRKKNTTENTNASLPEPPAPSGEKDETTD